MNMEYQDEYVTFMAQMMAEAEKVKDFSRLAISL